jgi:hypothetical protein
VEGGVENVRHFRRILIAGLSVALIWTVACGDDADPQGGATEPTPEVTATPLDPEFVEFDPANFSNSTVIDNEWTPMTPGTKWAYEGYTLEEGARVEHRIEFTVTDLVKEIEGVRTVMAWIVDIADGEVVEKEVAFYAQDNDGNVWYFGEHPEEYENGEFLTAPTWIAGIEEARPGVKMWSDPQIGIPSYFQGWAPTVEWSDYGIVDAVGQEFCTPVDCYQDVLVIAESSLDEAGIYQLKYYARGVGEVGVGWRGEPEAAEELALVEHTQLSAEGLAAVRAEALAMEAHAYEISGEYSFTPPSEQS